MALIARDGNVTVTLDADFEALAREAIEGALPGVQARMLEDVTDLFDLAKDQWPIETGKSMQGLKVTEEIDIGRSAYTVRVVGNATGRAPYTVYVKPKKWHGASTAWQRLIRGPLFNLHKEYSGGGQSKLGKAIVAGVQASLKGGS